MTRPLSPALLAILLAVLAAPLSARPQEPDAYADPGVRRLLERAREARGRRDSALQAFDVTWRERIYFGVSAERFRRERSLLDQRRAARVRWSPDERTVSWLGVRRETPIGDTRVEFTEDFEFLDPASDRIFMGGAWGVHPLADSAVDHYRYRSGDTLTIRLPGLEVRLAEVIVEPREARFDLVRGALWFDLETAVLARAAYRPSRDFDLRLDEPEDAEDVPGWVPPIRASVRYIVVDYGLQELSWWLPARLAFEGEVRLGGLAEFPFQTDWTLDDYVIDPSAPLVRGDSLPEGWRREVRPPGRDSVRLVVVIPPEDSLWRSPELPGSFDRDVRAFDPDELASLREAIAGARAPGGRLPGPRLLWGPGLLRYNRVEALSVGVGARIPTGGRTSLRATARLATADLEPDVQAHLRHEGPDGGFALGVYRRLQPAGDWGRPLGIGNSLGTLLLGYDDGVYYRAAGAELEASRTVGRARLDGGLFAERHRTAGKETDVSLPAAFGADLPSNIEADAGDVLGARAQLRVQSGVDADDPIAAGRLWTEAGTGDFEYGQIAATLALLGPTAPRWSGAVEIGAGVASAGAPRQRLWFLGGSYTLRGFEAGDLEGEAFWMARAELGRTLGVGPPRALRRVSEERGPVRLVAFADAGWAGPRESFGTDGWALGAGLGLSVLEGLFRVDLARGFRRGDAFGRGDAFRLHLYSDGLF